MPQQYDLLLVGGGVMGCAIAYALLKKEPTLRLALIEKEPSYARSSTILSDGNTRVQFNLPENIAMSLYGLEVLAQFAEEMRVDDDRPMINFRQQGNLFIVDAASEAECRAGWQLQQQMGANVAWLTPTEVQARYPLYNLHNCVAGTFGPHDGTMSPSAVLLAYKKKVLAWGAKLIVGEVCAVELGEGRVQGVRLTDGTTLSAPVVVNTAGAWAGEIGRMAGIDLPVVPIKRQVTIFASESVPHPLPAIFLPSGLYCFHEGEGVFMCGKSFADDPITTTDFQWDRTLFEERIWPELVDHFPAFDRLQIKGGWAGLYEMNTFDENAILGEWPTLPGFFVANGFSGHGFQQCHAVGRYLAECILQLPHALDLSRFSAERLWRNTPLWESPHKLI